MQIELARAGSMTLSAARRPTLRTYSGPRIRQVISNIGLGLPDHVEIANLALQIGADYHGRFVIEMLQNASDQASKAGLVDSTVTITRTEHAVYVTNQGEVFDDQGLKTLTQLGVSDKAPDQSIGNKGLGFKSIMQVASAAEVYSAPARNSSFTEPGGLRFEIRMRPLDEASLADLRDIAEELIPDEPRETREALGADPAGRVMAEIRKSAPFRFPLGVTDADLEGRLADSRIPSEIVAAAQTLVVIPVIDDAHAQTVVAGALKELEDFGGATLLFLPAVARVVVEDRVQGQRLTLTRKAGPRESLQKGVTYARLVTTAERAGSQTSQSWRVVERTLGVTDDEAGRAEREQIRAATRELPGAGWDEVETARVVVGLPESAPDAPEGAPLPASGLFSIGLPTRMRTGTPFWVDARFHGTISRTEIDLDQTPYNALLFGEAKSLVAVLLDRLKRSARLELRRLATQSMSVAVGPLGEWMRTPGGIADSEVILDAQGTAFVRPDALALPSAVNVQMMFDLAGAEGVLDQYRFVLPETALLLRARELIEELAPRLLPSADDRFLRRVDGVSLLERGAKAQRRAGPAFWDRFFSWVLERFTYEQLADQVILPVGESDLLPSSSNVFYSPRPAASDEEEDIGAIPEHIVSTLRFLDETAAPMRENDSRTLTPLARRLAPETPRGLVRAPLLPGLINDAIAPRLSDAVDSGDMNAAVRLLQLALEWLRRLSDARLPLVERDRILVPCATHTESPWSPPSEAYFGAGWLDNDIEALILAAYGQHNPILVSWSDLRSMIDADHDREWWLEGLRRLGVNDAPRLLLATSRTGVLNARSRTDLAIVEWSCPLGGDVQPYWIAYLRDVAAKCAPVSRTGRYSVREVTWIDGLERAESRSAVVDLLLRTHERYVTAAEAKLERTGPRDFPQKIESLWIHALRSSGWDVIPTTQGRKQPADSWLLTSEQQRRADTYRLISSLTPPFDLAGDLLLRIGVAMLSTATPTRLIGLLHSVAAEIETLSPPQHDELNALVHELYANLAGACRDESISSISEIAERPVPLLMARRLVAADLGSRILYVDDDVLRTQFLSARDDVAFLPISRRSVQTDLVAHLRKLLGEDRVVYTSEAAIATHFVPLGEPATSVLEYLAGKEARIERDLALVYAYDRDQVAPSGSPGFQYAWRRLANTLIRRGSFPPGFEYPYFFEPLPAATLDVSAELDHYQIIEALWAVLGKDSRNPLSAYASALKTGRADSHFAARGIGPSEIHEVEATLGLSSPDRLAPWHDLFYAVWRNRRPGEGLTLFLGQIAQQRSITELATWLGVDAGLLFSLEQRGAEADAIALLESNGTSAEEWQAARRAFDKPMFEFASTRARYVAARERLAWGLASVAAHLPSVDLDAARRAVELILGVEPSATVVGDWQSDATATQELSAAALTSLSSAASQSLRPLVTRVERLRDMGAGMSEMTPQDASDREIWEYARTSDDARGERAGGVFGDIMRLATPVAARFGETVDEQALRTDARVAALLAGWWASPFGLLETLRRALQSQAPGSAKALSDAGVFQELPDWRRFWARLRLGPLPSSGAAQPEQDVDIGGVARKATDVFADLLNGPGGEIGASLASAVQHGFDFASLRMSPRDDVVARVARIARGGRPSGAGKPPKRVSKVDRDLNGLMGEAFVYEQLRADLGMDYLGWVSSNRQAYGLPDTGTSDDLGYDFECIDPEGRLSGIPGAACHIEVKSSGSEARDDFPMTSAEWRDAERCHAGGATLYLIVRVANVRGRPEIVDCLLDPVGLWRRGKLTFDHDGLVVRIAPPTPPSAAPNTDAAPDAVPGADAAV